MSENTKIEWADHSWSPWRGCTKVSPGCANCYAEKLSRRNPAVLGEWGRGKPRVLAKNWGDPVRWNKRAQARAEGADREASAAWGEFSELMVSEPPRVFPSLCDWLDEEVPAEWLARFLGLIHDTPNLDWLLLTKRPENFRRLLERALEPASWPGRSRYIVNWLNGTPPPNVWFGVSVEDQHRADERIPVLLRIPARVRWLSVEPLLGPVDLKLALRATGFPKHITADGRGIGLPMPIHWVVIGGESGPGARPCLVECIRSLIHQGRDAGVPVFVKQLGARPLLRPCRQHHFDWRDNTANATRPDDELFAEDGEHWRVLLRHPKGGDPAEWPEHLRVRQYPT